MAARKNAQDIRIDDLKEYMGSQFGLVIKGQEALFRKFDEHAADDKKQFEQINLNVLSAKQTADQGIRDAKTEVGKKFEEIDLNAAKAEGSAQSTAKIWGAATGLGGTGILGLIWEIWAKFHGVK